MVAENNNDDKEPRGNKVGRPFAEIDWEKVGTMLEQGCTTEGIAATIGVERSTLRRRCWHDNKIRYTAFVQQKRAKGNDQLRAVQYRLAIEGNPTMLVWLGKQRLGQSDKTELTGKSGEPLQVVTRVVRVCEEPDPS